MDITQLMPWLLGINTLMSIGTVIYAVMTSGAKKTAGDLEKHRSKTEERWVLLDKILDDHAVRIQSIEGEMKHLPDKDLVHQLQMTMKDIQIEMAGVKAETQAAARTSRRVEEFLMRTGGDGAS
ncbi:conserved hypothetical protein [Mesorhizobium sp. ORS 3359]|nr:conserved hypothetical protein [Mesorhizobium sp. ORS 3359]